MRRLLAASVALMAVSGIAAGIACGGDNGKNPSATPTRQATAASDGYLAEVKLSDRDNGATVKLAQGGRLTISLESNPSTGFSWLVSGLAGPELQLVGEPEYVPPPSTTPVVGAAGAQVFTFGTTGIGMPPKGQPAIVQVALEYKRSFEADVPAEKTFRATVEIE